jgi:hypothetical protein
MDITTGWYFESGMRIAGYALVAIALTLLAGGYYLAALVFALLGIIVLTTRYGFQINSSAKTYREYTWFFGLKNGQWKSYQAIQYLFVKSARVSRRYNTRVQSRTITRTEFNGYVKFSESEKIHVANAVEKEDLIKVLIALAGKLETAIVDYTVEPPQVIER